MSEHTPIPWRWDGEDLWHFGVGYSDELDPHRYTGISIDRRLRSSPILEKNMEFIVNAVNSHDALVKALKRVSDVQSLRHGNATNLHLAMIDVAKEVRAALEAAGEPL